MSFLDDAHRNRIVLIEELWTNLKQLNDLAKLYGIDDIFQDNGAKILQQLIYLNFECLPGREGNDAIDVFGIEWEMKSINTATTASGFSTNHHTTFFIINKFRSVPWSFAIYYGVELKEIYVMSPETLEPLFSHWERKLNNGMNHLNNPKIPIKFVRANGVQVYPINEAMPVDPSVILGECVTAPDEDIDLNTIV